MSGKYKQSFLKMSVRSLHPMYSSLIESRRQMCSKVLPWCRQLLRFNESVVHVFLCINTLLACAQRSTGFGGLVVQKLSTSRWSARVDATAALAKDYDAILAALCEIVNNVDETANARIEARGLRDRMDQLERAILTEVWFQILSQLCAQMERSIGLWNRRGSSQGKAFG